MPQAPRDCAKNVITIIILLLSLGLRAKALLPAFLQILQADVAYALVCALGVGEVVDGGLYGKEQWSSTGT